MHRVLAICVAVAWFSPRNVAAQNFQFMQLPAVTPTSLLPLQTGVRGFLAGDDFDGNGYTDLLVTAQNGAMMFRGNAAGAVSWTQTALLAWAQQKPRIVDLDGDGDRDLAFVPPYLTTPTTVLVFRNTPSGMSPVALPSAMNGVPVHGVALGDVDGNGFADMIVAATTGWGTPSLMIARGGPALAYTLDLTAMPANVPFGLWPELLDADGDGDLDVLATNATSGLRLLTNVGGSFVDGTASLPPARTGHVQLAAADFDGDGRSDCAATHGTSGDVDLLWGGGPGLTFVTAAVTVPLLRSLTPADFDGDGDLDLLAEHGEGLDVLWNQGNRQFLRSNVVSGSLASRGAADVDRDGKTDVLYVITGIDRVVRCKFAAIQEAGDSVAGIGGINGWATPAPLAADFDGDSRTDVVLLSPTQWTFARALGGNLYQRTTQPFQNQVSGLLWRTQAADMDRDGDVDVVVRDDFKVAIADNDGTGTFAWTLQRASPNSALDDMRLADVDGDSDLDILHSDPAGPALIRNLGGGQYAPSVVLAGPNAAKCLEIADVDGDGDGDVISMSATSVTILANNGAGGLAANPAFQLSAALSGSYAPTSLCAGDFDGDGDQDLVVSDYLPRMFRNNGNGVFLETTATDLPLPTSSWLSNCVAADLDADGDLDLTVIIASAASPVLLLVNDGSGRFTDRSSARVQPVFSPGSASHLRAVDYDDDGDLDLLAAGQGPQFLLVNHLRHCRMNVAARLGGVADFHLFSGPGFGQPGTGLLGVGFALASPPLRLPGVTGQLDLDPTLLQIVTAFTTSPVGVSSAFVAVPLDQVLFGLEVWFQAALLPTTGIPAFTNAVAEVVTR